MGTISEITPPTDWPVTLAEARVQCRLMDDATHDNLLTRLIKAATQQVETQTGSKLMPRTLMLTQDGFPSRDIALPTYPVTAITSVVYDDADDAEQTVDSGDYYTNLGGLVPLLRAVDYWPATLVDKPGSVRITFTAGYGNIDEIPDDLRHQILMLISLMFAGDGEDLTDGALAKPYRVF